MLKDESCSKFLEDRVNKKNSYYQEKIKENNILKIEHKLTNLPVSSPYFDEGNLKKMKNYLLLKKPIVKNSYTEMIDEEISKSKEFLKKSHSFIFNNMIKIQEDRK